MLTMRDSTAGEDPTSSYEVWHHYQHNSKTAKPRMQTTLLMFLLVGSSRAFQMTCRGRAAAAAKSTTTLRMSLFEDLQKGFAASFSTDTASPSKYYTIGITGSSGLVANALKDELSRRREGVNGKPIRIVNLKRGDTAERVVAELPDSPHVSITWNPQGRSAAETMDPVVAADLDAIVHLAGENVATGEGPLGFLGLRAWSPSKKEEILKSRTVPTAALARVVAATPKPQTFLVASGIGAYGADFIGDARAAVDETADTKGSDGFLAEVTRQWEAASAAAKTGRNRVVNMRFGVVLSKQGGALGKLFPIFFLGGGGNVGSGDQYFSFISARDQARAIIHTLETSSLAGPVNFSSPAPCTNAEFTQALGKGLSRPTILPFPAFAVSLLFGEMGEEMLLGGVRATPGKLEKSGFVFAHPNIEEAVKSALDESI
jgi:uncharacterized protein (TIGR01777 family)